MLETPVFAPDAQTEYLKKMLGLARFRTILCGVMAFVILLLGAFALRAGVQISSILTQAETTFTRLDSLSADIEASDVPGMIQEINVLVKDGQTAATTATRSMQAAADKIDALDIESLNQSIQDFAAVVDPLSKLFGR